MASYEQNKNNRQWSARFRAVEFGEVKNKRLRGFSTKKEAEKAVAEYLTKHQLDNKKSNYCNLTFTELYNKYIEHKESRTKVGTIYATKKDCQRHILPFFENSKIYKISKSDILLWQEKLNKEGLSYRYKSKLRSFLHSIFKHAVLYYDLPTNPVNQVEPFKKLEIQKEMLIWSEDEFKTFIQCVDDKIYQTFFYFLYLTGCRKGEAMGLDWNSVNFDTNELTIERNLTKDVEGQKYAIVTPKTNKSRKILMPKFLSQKLNELKSTQVPFSPNNFVFGGSRPLAFSTVTRAFNRGIDISGVKKIHIHCLRHSHTSLLISQGETIVMVAKRLGHSSIEQTLNTYSHLMPNEEQKMISKLDNINF